MVRVTKGPEFGGRPEFRDADGKKRAPEGRLFEQNSLLSKLAPSNRSSPFVEKLQWLINKILSIFHVYYPSTFENRLVKLLQAAKGEGADLAIGDISAHFREFLDYDKEVSPQLKQALDKAESEHKEKRTDEFFVNKKKELEALKVGESRLIPLQGKNEQVLDSSLFAILTKEADGFSVKLIGKGATIGELETAYSLAGREKVNREIVFEKVPEYLILTDDCIANLYSEKDTANDFLQTKLTELAPYKKEVSSFEELTTKTDKTAKLFWNIVHAFPLDTTKGIAQEKRIKLRSHLLNLFEFFRNNRFSLVAHSSQHQNIRKLFMAVSGEVLEAYQKGVISKEDLTDIRKEFEIIDSALRKAEQEGAKPLTSSVANEKHLFPGVTFEDFTAKVMHFTGEGKEIEQAKPSDTRALRPLIAPTLSQKDALSFQPYTTIKTKDAALSAFRTVQGDDRTLLAFIHEIPVSLHESGENFRSQKSNSFWWSLSATEMEEVASSLTSLVERSSKDTDQITQEALFKAAYLVSAFETETLGYNINNSLTDTIGEFYGEVIGTTGRTIYDTDAVSFARAPTILDPFNMAQSANLRAVREFHGYELRDLSRKGVDHPLTKRIENALFSRKGLSYSSPRTISDRLKRIDNHFLIALYRQMDTRIHWQPDDKKKEKVESIIGWMSPEAVQTDPEGLLAFFFDELEKANEAFSDKNAQDKLDLAPFPLHYTDDDKRQILRLLRSESPQVEAINLLLNSPNLLLDYNTRNFLDAIFFHPNLLNLMHDHSKNSFLLELPEKIALALERFKDPKDAKEFEAKLFLIELLEKLQGIYKNPEWKYYQSRRIGEIDLSQAKFPQQTALRFPGYEGNIARLELRRELAKEQSDPEKLLTLFQTAFTGESKAYLIDPYLEQVLKNRWHDLLHKIDFSEIAASQDGLLDRLIIARGIKLDAKPWRYLGNYTYTNDTYNVCLDTLSITSSSNDKKIDELPPLIFQSNDFKAQFKELPKTSFPVTISQDGDKTIYAFKDLEGVSCRIVVDDKNWTLYKKTADKWLQLIPGDVLARPKSKTLEPTGVINTLLKYFRMLSKSLNFALPSLFKNGIYVDPADPKIGYLLLGDGTIDLEFTLSQGKDGIELDSCKVSKTNKNYQLNLDSDFEQSGLEFLHGFERPENILIWSDKGKIEKVELSRYGLSCHLNSQNQLVIDDPKFAGYHIVANPKASDRKHLSTALVLEHIDPTKPKKLLLPSSDALATRDVILKPSAWALGHVLLFFHRVLDFIRTLMGKAPYQPLSESRMSVNAYANTINYSVFDLRAYTEEICLKPDDKAQSIIELTKHYLKERDFARAYEITKRLSFTLDNKAIQELVEYIKKPDELVQESALKFKLLVELKVLLKKERQQKKVIDVLNTLLLDKGKAAVSAGRSLPKDLKLTDGDKIELSRIAKAKDPKFYEKQLKVLFTESEQEFELGKEEDLPDNLEARVEQWKKERIPRNRDTTISNLESSLQPNERLDDAKLTYPFVRLPEGQEIHRLFTPKDVAHLFRMKEQDNPTLTLNDPNKSLAPCEQAALQDLRDEVESYNEIAQKEKLPILNENKKALKAFVDEKIIPLRDAQDKELDRCKHEIEELINKAPGNEEQFEIFSGKRSLASFDELRIGFGFDKFDQLELPAGIDVARLKTLLTSYFEALVKKNALDASLLLVDRIELEGGGVELSKALYQLLTVTCAYDAAKDPRFLVFEAQQYINFKSLEAGLDQLQLVEKLLTNPYAVVQAPTGAGKTSVLDVMRSLCMPNGENLVIQKVLPPLYQQTFDQFQNVLGNLFGMTVYPLRFSMKMRLTKTEYVKDKPTKVSLFKVMYDELLATIQNRGCVLTDYKSLPLLEEKFWRLSQELLEMRIQGVEPQEILLEHHKYLQKILLLLANKGVENQDEFDQPNRPIKKIQLDLQVGATPIAPFMIDTAIELYELLKQDNSLGLKDNIQQAITDEMRAQAIRRAADTLAGRLFPQSKEKLVSYLLGQNEDILQELDRASPQLKDKIAFLQREFTQFLKLSLTQKEGTNYARSDDGRRTVTCHDGEKTEAKQGTLEEQINATIQDYIQTGIREIDLRLWFDDLSQKFGNSTNPQYRQQLTRQLHDILPEANFGDQIELAAKVAEINQNPGKITFFLRFKLATLKSSGRVISMGPQDIINMSRAVSGTSATVGAPDSLHPQFQVDKQMNGLIRANMASRLAKRARDMQVLTYDPRTPEALLQEKPFDAVIDGSGAFNHLGGEKTASALKDTNPALKQVGYHGAGDKIAFVGQESGDLKETGFIFTQSHTRGTDIPLKGDAHALLTHSEQDGLRDLCQKEGRLRKPTQTYQAAVSEYQSDIKTVSNMAVVATCKDAQIDAKDIFKTQSQRIAAEIRKEARWELLNQPDLTLFLDRFSEEGIRNSLITQADPGYKADGDYFKRNCRLKFANVAPDTALNEYKKTMQQEALRLNLPTASQKIGEIQYSQELIERMPEYVTNIGRVEDELEMELEVEQEEEIEQEEQLELSLETEQEKVSSKDLGYYPVRTRDTIFHSVRDKIYPAYDSKIQIADSFLPLSRKGTRSLRQRDAFDEAMFRVGIIHYERNYNRVAEAYDPPTYTLLDYIGDTGSDYGGFYYDMRTDTVVQDFYARPEEVIQTPEFKKIKSQIKFFDGQCYGYTAEELNYLREWLVANNPTQMKNHLLNQILRHRYKDKIDFEGSQLQALFNELRA